VNVAHEPRAGSTLRTLLRPAHLAPGALFAALASPAGAQDVRRLEICTAEIQIDRHTVCLQANVE